MVRILIVILILVSSTTALGAGFAKVGTFGFSYDGMFTGTRNTALGQGDMAGAYGPGATMINTAPLPLGDGVEVSYNRNPFLAETDFSVWGVAAEFQGLRAGYSRLNWFMDPQMVRTAYNPEGTGETFDAGDRISVLSLGYDLGRLIDDEGHWNWTIGGAWRHYYAFLAHSEVSDETFDLGTSVAWTAHHSKGWTKLIWAWSWQNFTNVKTQYDERESALPASIRMGFTIESGFGRNGWGGEAFRVLAAYSRRFMSDDWYGGYDTDHFGLEMIPAGILAFRMGHNSRLPGDINSWGIGLILDQEVLGWCTLTGDYGKYDTFAGDVSMWSVRARYAF